MSRGLDLNSEEEQRYNEFKTKHCGVIYFKVYPTGLGDKIMVCCEGCNEELDITDYNCW